MDNRTVKLFITQNVILHNVTVGRLFSLITDNDLDIRILLCFTKQPLVDGKLHNSCISRFSYRLHSLTSRYYIIIPNDIKHFDVVEIIRNTAYLISTMSNLT